MIDSDEKVEEFIPDIFQKEQTAEVHDFQQLELKQSGENDTQAAFENGLSVIHMDDVVNQEMEKVEQQISEQKQQILEEAEEEAARMIKDAEEQSASIKQSAYIEGVEQGLAEGKIQAAKDLEQKRQELEQEYERRFQELKEQEENLEPAFADLTVSLVRKLTGVVCEDKKGIILYLIGSAMKNMERTKTLILRVSKSDIGRVMEKKSTFQMLAKGIQEFDIVEDENLTENQCIIEMDNKVIDCSLDAQLQNLEESVKLLVF